MAVEKLKSLGFANTSDAVPWREAYPDSTNEQLAGKALAGMRYREGLTQMQLATKTGIPQRHISEMENGKRTIGKKNAKLFAEALKTDYRVFL
ncbi:MAG: helix-turn-helix transcriptional regulator [Smithella sp.]|jgi:DNA-binding XRE family transcriptional regulator